MFLITEGSGADIRNAQAAIIVPVETETEIGEETADESGTVPVEEAEIEETEAQDFYVIGEEDEEPAFSAGQRVVNFALQFVGNPYAYGGTSLTNGADCSGFVMSVYRNFGVSLPHSSSALASVGQNVGTNLANAQPGDLICYSGHVGIYIGGGQIVHASTERSGIKVSGAGYKAIRSIRRII